MLHPFWPKQGRPARLVLLRAIRGGRGPARLLPGLTLHRADGSFTAEAESILRDGAGLPQ
jgi:tRNA1(Val) A37 N6-methylase TrmN6